MKKSEPERHKNSNLPDKLSILESEKKSLLFKKKIIERKILSVDRTFKSELNKYFKCDKCFGFILKKKVSLETEERCMQDGVHMKIKFYICPYCGSKVDVKKESI